MNTYEALKTQCAKYTAVRSVAHYAETSIESMLTESIKSADEGHEPENETSPDDDYTPHVSYSDGSVYNFGNQNIARGMLLHVRR